MKTTTAVTHISSPDSESMIVSFLNAHPQGVLTTINKQGNLQSSVINVYELDNYHLAFVTKKDSRKFLNLQSNPTTAFMTYDAFSRSELEIQGVAQVIHDKKEQEEILNIIKTDEKNGKRHTPPFLVGDDDYGVLVIYPRKIHMTTYWERESGMEAFHESIEFDLSMKS